MIQVFLEGYQSDQISVSRKFRITENNTVSINNVVHNSTIKKSLIVATDLTDRQHIEQKAVIKNFLITAGDSIDAQHVEQNLVIRNFLITARKEHYYGF